MKKIFVSILFFVIAIMGSVWGYVVLYHQAENQSIDTSYTQEQNHAIQKEPLQPVTILFAGDMNFDRYIRTMAEKNGYDRIFAHIEDDMHAVDCVFANMEGPMTDNVSRSEGSAFGSASNYQFTFDPIVRDLLIDYNMCAVNLGNNHIGNFGDQGIASTKAFLDEKKIAYIGDTGMADEKRDHVIDLNGVKIGVINYNQFVSHAHEHVLADLLTIRDHVDFVVVYAHWGVEYAGISRAQEQMLAHELIDAGADVIIGSHPHVVQEIEDYHGKKIYYSLGNFVFDQYFRLDTQKGLMVAVTFDKEHDMITFRDHMVCMQHTGVTTLCDPAK